MLWTYRYAEIGEEHLVQVTFDEMKSVGGFFQVAEWRRSTDGIISCEGDVPSKPGLYLFAVEQHVRYVGSALERLDKWMQSYQRRQRDNRSNRPVHAGLAEAINKGERVEIYVRPIPENARNVWQGLPVSVILGVEAALIADLNPLWNRRGRVLLLDTESVDEKSEDVAV